MGTGKRNGALTGGLPAELISVVAGVLEGVEPQRSPKVPAHIARTLKSRLGARPVRRAVALTPRPDPRAIQRLHEVGLTPRDLRLRGPASEPRVARATETLLDALTTHHLADLRLPMGRVEAMARALAYLLWFLRRYAGGSPLDLHPDAVRACFGNYYIRRHRGPELTWIHYGVRGSASLAAFLCRAGWWDVERAQSVVAVADNAAWFRDRLEQYWLTDGDGLADWIVDYDFEELEPRAPAPPRG